MPQEYSLVFAPSISQEKKLKRNGTDNRESPRSDITRASKQTQDETLLVYTLFQVVLTARACLKNASEKVNLKLKKHIKSIFNGKLETSPANPPFFASGISLVSAYGEMVHDS